MDLVLDKVIEHVKDPDSMSHIIENTPLFTQSGKCGEKNKTYSSSAQITGVRIPIIELEHHDFKFF